MNGRRSRSKKGATDGKSNNKHLKREQLIMDDHDYDDDDHDHASSTTKKPQRKRSYKKKNSSGSKQQLMSEIDTSLSAQGSTKYIELNNLCNHSAIGERDYMEDFMIIHEKFELPNRSS
jgi:hypothetical protein